MRKFLLTMLAMLTVGISLQAQSINADNEAEGYRYRSSQNRRSINGTPGRNSENYLWLTKTNDKGQVVAEDGDVQITTKYNADLLKGTFVIRDYHDRSFAFDNAFGAKGSDIVIYNTRTDAMMVRANKRFYPKQFEWEFIPHADGNHYYLRNHYTKLYMGKLNERTKGPEATGNANAFATTEYAYTVTDTTKAALFRITTVPTSRYGTNGVWFTNSTLTPFNFYDIKSKLYMGMSNYWLATFGYADPGSGGSAVWPFNLTIYKLPEGQHYEQKEYKVTRKLYWNGVYQRDQIAWVVDGGTEKAPTFYGATLSTAGSSEGGSDLGTAGTTITGARTVYYNYVSNPNEFTTIDISDNLAALKWNYIAGPVNGGVYIKGWFDFLQGTTDGAVTFQTKMARRGIDDAKTVYESDAMRWAFYGNPVLGYKVINKAAGTKRPLVASTRSTFGGRIMRGQPFATATTLEDGDLFYIEKSVLTNRRNALWNLRVEDPVADVVNNQTGAYLYNSNRNTLRTAGTNNIGTPSGHVNILSRYWYADRKASLRIASVETLFTEDFVTEEYVGGMKNDNIADLTTWIKQIVNGDTSRGTLDDWFKKYNDYAKDTTTLVSGAYYQLISSAQLWGSEVNGTIVKEIVPLTDDDGEPIWSYTAFNNDGEPTDSVQATDTLYYDPIEAVMAPYSDVKENMPSTATVSGTNANRPYLTVLDSFNVAHMWQLNVRPSYPNGTTNTSYEKPVGTQLPVLRAPNYDYAYVWPNAGGAAIGTWNLVPGVSAGSTDVSTLQTNKVGGFVYRSLQTGTGQYRIRMHGTSNTNYAFRLQANGMNGARTNNASARTLVENLVKGTDATTRNIYMMNSGVNLEGASSTRPQDSTLSDTADIHYSWMIRRVKEMPVKINSAAGFATLHFPFAVQVPTTSGITTYVASGNDANYVYVDEKTAGTIIPAQTPIIVVGAAGDYFYPIISGEDVDPTGTYTRYDNTSADKAGSTLASRVEYLNGNLQGRLRANMVGQYVASPNGSTPLFRKLKENTTIPYIASNRVYLPASKVTTGANAKSIMFRSLEDITLGIDNISQNEQAEQKGDGKFYNLDGTVAPKTESGKIYIHNGRKVFIP